ncbi:general transcription factor 3C polypeptide 3-like isoform X2 [Chelonus insularis]|uniref:general transcription factor 3C polypeptide 3-like isoform X2 n=1 Tax=Chelonus insularis TaxID=460826 RepID=UPI00158AF37C|nr:general transcription factor 3C polypeptide 3-like isoform X2 [Chelonus insularis]XP_034933687.1 general transcription factor 3C polypeptide 3-like isoform X2 [Chelonus insularis]
MEKMEVDSENEAEDFHLRVLSPSSEGPLLIDETPDLAPVIIEELEESQVANLNEFIEANALEICEINPEDAEITGSLGSTISNEDPKDSYQAEGSDGEDNDVLTPEEQERLTKQFLNGELTFSEYSSRMDTHAENETTENQPMIVVPSSSGRARPRESIDEKNEKKGRRKKKRRNLPLALQGLMGEANLRFAKGETDLAIKMCMEIIRQVPSAPEPFQTLAMIYETRDPEKALQFSLIAAHLNPKDVDQWIKLANISLDSGDIKQAITCYSKAIQANPKDVALYEERAKLQEQTGDVRASIKGYMKLIHQLGPEDGEYLINYAKIVAQKFIQENNHQQALEAMEQIFNKCPDLVTLEEVNIITELLITSKKFTRCLDILSRYTSISVKYHQFSVKRTELIENDSVALADNSGIIIESCIIPNDVVVDLKAKCIVAVIELNNVDKADGLINQFLKEEHPDASGDLFLDVAEALMSRKEYSRSIKVLEPLINSENYSLAAVWLRYAECWVGCKNLKKAILAYEIVTKLSPQHLEAKLQLSTLYKCMKLYDRAIDILKQDPDVDVIDPDALYRKTMLLYKIKRFDEFLESGYLLLMKECIRLRSKAELPTLMRPRVRERREALHLHRLSRAEPLEDNNAPTFSSSTVPSFNDEYSLFIKMCQVAWDLKKYGVLERICFTALTSKKFEPKTPHIIFLCLLACIYNKDSYHAYNIIRDLVRDFTKPSLWNLLNVVIQTADDARHNRFIMRLLGENASFHLHLLHANNCLVSGTYKYALNDYVSLYKDSPAPLLALLIGVTCLQMACQKYAAKKHRLVIQAYTFFKKYAQQRGPEMKQESDYNIGRLLHQIGLLTGALHFYKLVLDSPPSELIASRPELFDLRREAAFNIHLIYMQSGNPDLARIYLDEYIVI